MKQRKNVLRGIMVMALVLAIVGTMAGCFGSGVQIVVDQESYTHEYGEIFMVPMATCSDGSEVIVQIFDADGYEVPVEYGTASLEKGEYKMVFTAGTAKKEEPAANDLTIGTIRLDLDARNAYKNGELADLTAKEFDVIEFLMRNPNRVYSRENLLDTIWAYEYRSDIRTVDVHIRRLREKLEENPAEPKHIMTKWGVGYYFKK